MIFDFRDTAVNGDVRHIGQGLLHRFGGDGFPDFFLKGPLGFLDDPFNPESAGDRDVESETRFPITVAACWSLASTKWEYTERVVDGLA